MRIPKIIITLIGLLLVVIAWAEASQKLFDDQTLINLMRIDKVDSSVIEEIMKLPRAVIQVDDVLQSKRLFLIDESGKYGIIVPVIDSITETAYNLRDKEQKE